MLLRLIDTHAHLNMEGFGQDIQDLLDRSAEGLFPQQVDDKEVSGFSIERVFVPGISVESTRLGISLAERFPLVCAAAGIHPNSIPQCRPNDWDEIETLAVHPRVVAVGETCLDRYWDTTPFHQQISFFERHIDLAKKRGLPIIIHSREADADLIPILRREASQLHGVIHAFSSDTKIAEQCLELGFYISFAGSVTYTNRKFAPLWEAAKMVPSNRILLETDAPYLTPHPYRSKLSRNEPLMTAWIAKRLAELRRCSLEDIVNQTTENARRLFGF